MTSITIGTPKNKYVFSIAWQLLFFWKKHKQTINAKNKMTNTQTAQI